MDSFALIAISADTPAYSPESNGMAEAFVKTFKRDYAYVNNLKDAETVLGSLPGWFSDYNEVAPHRGLKMMAPRQYRELSTTAG
jgi:transposase InsO family protein